MAITVIMQDSRPDGAGGTYKKGSTYSLPDPLATYFLDIGLAKRTSARSEQTGATVTGDSAGRFPSAPSQDKSVPLTATISSGGVDILDPVSGAALPLTQNLSPAGFKPLVLASLVAGATASQSGTTVTILATGHGVPATKNGSRFYFAGSASIPAGWYDGLTWVDANTLTFQRAASATVPAESINGGTALTGVFVKAVTFQLPGGALGDNGRVRANILRTGDTGAGVKAIRMVIGNAYASACTATAYPCGTASMTVWSKQSQTAQIAVVTNDGNTNSWFQVLSVNTAVDFAVDLSMSVTNPSQWVAIDAADLEVVRK